MTMNVTDQAHGEKWAAYCGDSALVLPEIPDNSIGLTISSIPFSSTYTYSPSAHDLGNVRSHTEFWQQMAWITKELYRVTMPGRVVCIHVADLPEYANTHGESGRYDLRGDTVRHFREHGWVYHSSVTINKNPQAQAIRNHSKGLLFVQLERDSAAMWQAWADYLLVFRKPGTNPKPVPRQISQEEWIKLAEPVWWDIRETDVLPVLAAKEEEDERHLCPLALPFIRNCMKLWSAPDDVVLDPFGGVGSTGVVAIEMGRRYIGVELKLSYHKVAVSNLRNAETKGKQPTLFDFSEVTASNGKMVETRDETPALSV